MHWMAGGDAVQLEKLGQLPIMDFFILLDKKIANVKKDIAAHRRATAGKSK